MESETVSVHRVECGNCGEVWETEHQTLDDFISEIAPDFHVAISEEYGAQGLICDTCFNDEESDWREYGD